MSGLITGSVLVLASALLVFMAAVAMSRSFESCSKALLT